MEEKDFPWLCKLLATSKARINIPETLLYHSDVLESWIYPDSTGGLRKHSPGEEGIKTMVDACKYFASKSPPVLCSTPVCYLISKSSRFTVETHLIDALPDRRDLFQRVYAVQDYRQPKLPAAYWHFYHVLFEPGQGYVSSFHRLRNGVKEVETSPRLLHKVKDSVRVIMSVVEETRQKRVLELGLEVVIDEDNGLWIMGAKVCTIASPGFTSLPSQLTVSSKEKATKLAGKPALNPSNKPSRGSKSNPNLLHKLTFKRGQLRCVDSNLNSPLRILSPSYSRDSLAEPISSEAQETVIPASDPKASLSTLKTKSFAVKIPRCERLFHPNFQEMLLLQYAKKAGIVNFDYNQIAQEVFYEEQDAGLNDTAESPSKVPRRPTQMKNEVLLAFEADVSDSSIDEGSMSSLESDQSEMEIEHLPPIVKTPIKRFNVTKRQLYAKGAREGLAASLKPVLSERKLHPRPKSYLEGSMTARDFSRP